jgi:hypothetical protein
MQGARSLVSLYFHPSQIHESRLGAGQRFLEVAEEMKKALITGITWLG